MGSKGLCWGIRGDGWAVRRKTTKREKTKRRITAVRRGRKAWKETQRIIQNQPDCPPVNTNQKGKVKIVLDRTHLGNQLILPPCFPRCQNHPALEDFSQG